MQTSSVIGITGARYGADTHKARHIAAQPGITVFTGCAVGADAAAVAGALAANGLVHVYAVGNKEGQGYPRPGLPAHITWPPASGLLVRHFYAGGPLTVPLVARLARRSLAMVRALALAGGALVAFPATGAPPRAFGPGPFPACGSGTWATVAAAVRLSVPVFVVWPVAPSVVLPVAGTWAQATLFGVACWAFMPATAKMF